jgi:iron complex outermembrane receptor protein
VQALKSVSRVPLRRRFVLTTAIAALVAAGNPALSASGAGNLLDLSIEELLHVEITSASKKTQQISDIAAAVFVITRDDIRRSGATSIPELLRLAPGIEVAQIDSNKWAVTARGFNGRFANKLLVLMDGRALYTPSFGGVFWDVQDTLLDDIERIEIIRGPGGAIWGANAVNGVINIITRSARDTQGGELVATGSSGPSETGSLRYGSSSFNDAVKYRVYAKYLNQSGNEDYSGADTADRWHIGRVGTRADWTLADGNEVSATAAMARPSCVRC